MDILKAKEAKSELERRIEQDLLKFSQEFGVMVEQISVIQHITLDETTGGGPIWYTVRIKAEI